MQAVIADAGVSGRSPKRAGQSPDASDESVQTNGNKGKSRKVSGAVPDLDASDAAVLTGSKITKKNKQGWWCSSGFGY